MLVDVVSAGLEPNEKVGLAASVGAGVAVAGAVEAAGAPKENPEAVDAAVVAGLAPN